MTHAVQESCLVSVPQISMTPLGPVEEDELDMYILQHGYAPLSAGP